MKMSGGCGGSNIGGPFPIRTAKSAAPVANANCASNSRRAALPLLLAVFLRDCTASSAMLGSDAGASNGYKTNTQGKLGRATGYERTLRTCRGGGRRGGYRALSLCGGRLN